MKRFLSILLAVVMIFSLSVPAGAVDNEEEVVTAYYFDGENDDGEMCGIVRVNTTNNERGGLSFTSFSDALKAIESNRVRYYDQDTITELKETNSPVTGWGTGDNETYYVVFRGKSDNQYTIEEDVEISKHINIRNHYPQETVITFKGEVTVTDGGYLQFEDHGINYEIKHEPITVEFSNPITVEDGGKLEITQSKMMAEVKDTYRFTSDEGSLINVESGGSAKISAVEFETESDEPIISASGDVTIGYLTFADESSVMYNGENTVVAVEDGGNVAVRAGNFSATGENSAITVADGGSLSVTGGDISTAAPIEIPKSADVKLTGGSITSTSEEPAVSVASGASVKLGAEIASKGKVAVALDGGAEVEMNDGTKVTVGEDSGEGDSYVDNNGTIVLAAGSTVEQGETTTTLPNGGTVTDTEKGVAVSPNKPTTEGISLNYSAISLRVGKTAALTATVTPEGVESTVEWSSDNEAVATVDENGVVTAVKKGTATITASVDGKSAECVVTVTKKSSSGGSSSSGSSSSAKAGDIDKDTGKNGDISISPKNPDKGDKVTVTVEPDAGYILDAIKVTDEDGKKIKLTEKDENEYTFTMPAGDVSIETTFKPLLDTPAAIPASYADVNNHWAQSAINYVTARGMMTGSNGYFTPDESLTRGMIAQILYNLEGGTGTFALPYPDVTASDWCANAVSWAAANRIMDGYGSGLFGANDAISREQLAATLYRYAQAKGYNTSASVELTAFADGHTTSEWARPAMQWAVANGLFSGKSGSVLDPQGTATRAEVASILMRFCETIAK